MKEFKNDYEDELLSFEKEKIGEYDKILVNRVLIYPLIASTSITLFGLMSSSNKKGFVSFFVILFLVASLYGAKYLYLIDYYKKDYGENYKEGIKKHRHEYISQVFSFRIGSMLAYSLKYAVNVGVPSLIKYPHYLIKAVQTLSKRFVNN